MAPEVVRISLSRGAKDRRVGQQRHLLMVVVGKRRNPVNTKGHSLEVVGYCKANKMRIRGFNYPPPSVNYSFLSINPISMDIIKK